MNVAAVVEMTVPPSSSVVETCCYLVQPVVKVASFVTVVAAVAALEMNSCLLCLQCC